IRTESEAVVIGTALRPWVVGKQRGHRANLAGCLIPGERSHEAIHGFSWEIVQRGYACDRRHKSGWNLWVACVGPVLLSIDDVLVNRGVERFLHLAGRAGKFKDD